MNYQKIYNDLMERAKNRKSPKNYEKHHILPRCKGGDNNPDNLVKLSIREHFIAHKLLWYNDKSDRQFFYAYFCMAKLSSKNNNSERRIYQENISSREYETLKMYVKSFMMGENNIMRKRADLRKKASIQMTLNNPMHNPKIAAKVAKTLRTAMKGSGNGFYGKGHLVTGENNHFYGKNHTDDSRKKMSNGMKTYYDNNPKAKVKTESHILKVAEKTRTRYHIKKIQIFATDDIMITKVAEYLNVSEKTIRDRLVDSPFNKEPDLETMYLTPKKYKKHIKVYEDLLNISKLVLSR